MWVALLPILCIGLNLNFSQASAEDGDIVDLEYPDGKTLQVTLVNPKIQGIHFI